MSDPSQLKSSSSSWDGARRFKADAKGIVADVNLMGDLRAARGMVELPDG